MARKDDYRQRYKVERSFAWLGNIRRLLIRWERRFEVYAGFFSVAVLVVCLHAYERSRVVVGAEAPTVGRRPEG